MCKPTVEPYWKCLLAEVSRQDPTPIALQRFYLIFTVAAYLPVIFPMSFAVHFLGFKESHLSFDETILPPNDPDAPSFTQFISNFVTATSLLTGLSSVSLSLCAVATFTFYALLVSMDLNTRQRPYPWPKSWKTNNNICYQEMFAEPSRQDRMIRRPGNTLSNVFYLFSALVVLTSAFLRGDKDNAALPRIPGLIISDAIFGGMLLILSIASTAWHGCNAAWSHIADLWSMESVLAYFPMRIGSSGLFSVLLNQNFDFSTASSIASFVCFATYVCYIFFNGRRWYGEHKHGYWEDLCPVSVRNRLPNILLNKDDKHRKNPYLKPIGIGEIYMFALIPVFQNIPSFILAKALFKSAGSVFLVHIINKTLVIGWSYRLFERWGLDGCRHILFCDEKIKSAKKDGSSLQSFWVMLAAILSPTAALHFLTGITLLASYCHARSLEIVALSMQNAATYDGSSLLSI